VDIRIVKTAIDPVVVIETDYFKDERGFLIENYQKKRYLEAGIDYEFVQDIHSRSGKGVLRGFHFQDSSAPMAKLVRCTVGAILDVALDIRVGSPTFGKTVSVELTADNKTQLLVPPDFGHAFYTLSEVAEVQYKVSSYYTPSSEGTISWNDPDVGFDWPNGEPLLSRRDQNAISLAAYRERPAYVYPPYGGAR
jgi:dTDP-4-dehydrorhamnose 3,5-epimerase